MWEDGTGLLWGQATIPSLHPPPPPRTPGVDDGRGFSISSIEDG